jgi:hypothetical protein
VLVAVVEGRRQRGRPKLRWEYGITDEWWKSLESEYLMYTAAEAWNLAKYKRLSTVCNRTTISRTSSLNCVLHMPYNFPDVNINQQFFWTHTFHLKTANDRESLT